MKSSSFTCRTPLLPNRGVSPYVLASPSATCMEPSNRAENTPSHRERPSTIPRLQGVYPQGEWPLARKRAIRSDSRAEYRHEAPSTLPVARPEASHFNSGTTMKASGTKLARENTTRSQHRDAKTPDVLATRRRQRQLFQEVVPRLEACMFAGVRA